MSQHLLGWPDVPPQVRDAITAQIGPVCEQDVQSIPGQNGEFVAHIHGRIEQVFVKAIAADSPHAYLHKRERWAARRIASAAPSAPVPRVLWEAEAGADGEACWYVTAWELINDHARPIDLRRWGADASAGIDAVGQLGKLLTPCPLGAPSIVERLGGIVAKAKVMLRKPADAVYGRDLYETALNGFVIDRLCGDTLLHANLGPRHMLIKDQVVSVVGWSRACSGQAWVDPALFAPHLVAGGHPPEAVHALLWEIRAWRDTPPGLMAGLTALWTLYHLHEGHHSDRRDEASIRLADAGQEWLAYLIAQI